MARKPTVYQQLIAAGRPRKELRGRSTGELKRMLDALKPVPTHTYERRNNNPQWELPAVVQVTRMDNSICMGSMKGTITAHDLRADILDPLGGFAVVVHVNDPKGGETIRYAFDYKPIVAEILRQHSVLAAVPARSHPKSIRA